MAHLDSTNIHIKNIPNGEGSAPDVCRLLQLLGGKHQKLEMFGWFLSLKSCGKMIKCLNFLIFFLFWLIFCVDFFLKFNSSCYDP